MKKEKSLDELIKTASTEPKRFVENIFGEFDQVIEDGLNNMVSNLDKKNLLQEDPQVEVALLKSKFVNQPFTQFQYKLKKYFQVNSPKEERYRANYSKKSNINESTS